MLQKNVKKLLYIRHILVDLNLLHEIVKSPIKITIIMKIQLNGHKT